MSFHEWRQQLRLTEALPRLLAGDSVQVVARDLGYGSAGLQQYVRRLLGETRATTWGDWSNWHGSGAARTDAHGATPSHGNSADNACRYPPTRRR